MPIPAPIKLSAVVITYNEMGYIQKCIDSILFADEIIVVDSYSTDGTYEYLCNHPKVRIVQHPFKNFTAQKTYALSLSSYDWTLFVDADEVVSSALQSEILNTIQNPDAHEAYWFYRKFMFKNTPLRFSGWQTDKNHRLFRKSMAKYTDKKIVHETLEVDGTSGILKNRLIHYCYKNYGEYRAKMLRYGKMKAHEKHLKGKKFNYAKLIVKPVWKFFHNFIFRLGFLDLDKGLKICYLDALSVYSRYTELKSIERQRLHPPLTKVLKTPDLKLDKKQWVKAS